MPQGETRKVKVPIFFSRFFRAGVAKFRLAASALNNWLGLNLLYLFSTEEEGLTGAYRLVWHEASENGSCAEAFGSLRLREQGFRA